MPFFCRGSHLSIALGEEEGGQRQWRSPGGVSSSGAVPRLLGTRRELCAALPAGPGGAAGSDSVPGRRQSPLDGPAPAAQLSCSLLQSRTDRQP